MIAQPHPSLRHSRPTFAAPKENLPEDGSTRGQGWHQEGSLSPLAGQVQVFTSVHRNFFTDVMAQALRNAGQGMTVLIVQFYKGGINQGPEQPTQLGQNLTWIRCRLPYSIHYSINLASRNLVPQPTDEHAAILELWEFVQDAVESGRYDQVILEELSLAMHQGIVPEAEVLTLLSARPRHVDVVLLGQQMPEAIVQGADQVTKLRNSFEVAPGAAISVPAVVSSPAAVSSPTNVIPLGCDRPLPSKTTVRAIAPLPPVSPPLNPADILPGQLRIPGLD